MNTHILTGVDGANPLGFLAALGALAAASELDAAATLAWHSEGRWRPALTSRLTRDELIAELASDLRTWDSDPAIALSYTKADKGDKEGKVAQDLKPPPAEFSGYLRALQTAALSGPLPDFLQGARRPLDYAAAFATEFVTDNNGNTKPTALHFTAGQQEFLKAVLELVAGVTADDLTEALFGPWRYERDLPGLGWDSSVSRDYARRADDPSKSKKTGVPGADWLAFRGLVFVPVFPVGDEVRTTGCAGGWKTGTFTWALWTGGLDTHGVRSWTTQADLPDFTAHQRRARGVAVLLRAAIRRSDQGGYGSFQPPEVVPPAPR